MSYRILVPQAGTDLASAFLGVMEDYPFVLLTPSVGGLDWSDSRAVTGYFDEKSPNLVIHFPQSYRTLSTADLRAAASLSAACRDKGVPLIQLSSYEVFGGAYQHEGVAEEIQPAPDTEIGRQFLLMEQHALANPQTLVLRLPLVLDLIDGCLFDLIIPRLMEGSLPPVSDHHRFRLISTGFVLRSLIALTHQIFCAADNWGCFHLRSSDLCSEAEFVDVTLRTLTAEAQLQLDMPQVISGRDEGRLLSGSANLEGRRCTDDFGIQFPSWRHGFKSLMRRWLHDRKLVPDLRRVER